jgi:hypothetical protein
MVVSHQKKEVKMKRESEYSKSLRDPRWQKIRLEVLQRDDFTCRACFNNEETLHVHHCFYTRDARPWDYPLGSLVTLCASCHETESGAFYEGKNYLSDCISRHGALYGDFITLGDGFKEGSLPHSSEVFFSAISSFIKEILTNPEKGQKFMDDYFEGLRLERERGE